MKMDMLWKQTSHVSMKSLPHNSIKRRLHGKLWLRLYSKVHEEFYHERKQTPTKPQTLHTSEGMITHISKGSCHVGIGLQVAVNTRIHVNVAICTKHNLLKTGLKKMFLRCWASYRLFTDNMIPMVLCPLPGSHSYQKMKQFIFGQEQSGQHARYG
jgi:hypothetical protein